MTREEMVKRHWKPYMVVMYQDHGMSKPCECLLSGIDFDSELLTLTPYLDSDYEPNEFKASLQFCTIPKRLRATSIHGSNLADQKDNFIKARKYP